VTRRTAVRRVAFVVGPLTLIAALVAGATPYADVAAGYAAKVAASAGFVTGRSLDAITAEELAFLPFVRLERDESTQAIEASVLPWLGRRAIVRDGLGATLLPARGGAVAVAPRETGIPPPSPDRPWPEGDLVAPLPLASLGSALEFAFATDGDRERGAPSHATRAVVIVHRGAIVAERYAPGFTPFTPLPGWSMAKSLTAALAGIAVRDGLIDPSAALEFPEWSEDARRAITLEHLLAMNSGLAFDEDYENPRSDVLTMLYREGNMAAYAASRPIDTLPGERFSYSSGSSLLVQRALRRACGDDAAYHALPYRELFTPLRIARATLEVDAAGTFVGSSYAHLTAREWARFGLLFLREGDWFGERVLPATWVRRCVEGGTQSANYGFHFWVNRHPEREFGLKSAPRDAYYAAGHEGQYLVIVPSRELVVVRLGLTQGGRAFPLDAFLAEVLTALQ
jgi:CubicO group peptidase (beta-lactamase class C family)